MYMSEFDPAVLLARAIQIIENLEHPLVALEAFWDGDTSGWFLIVTASIDNPNWYQDRYPDGSIPAWLHPRYEDRDLFLLQGKGGDLRIFNGLEVPWPEGVVATEVC